MQFHVRLYKLRKTDTTLATLSIPHCCVENAATTGQSVRTNCLSTPLSTWSLLGERVNELLVVIYTMLGVGTIYSMMYCKDEVKLVLLQAFPQHLLTDYQPWLYIN